MSVSTARRPRRVVARAISLGIGALVAAGLLTWSPTPTSGWNQGAAEGTLWQLLNGSRVNNGMAPLQQHGTLVGLARWRSSDMLAKDYFSHTIAGCGCLVYAYYDSNGLNYVWGGENIGWNSGLSDAQSPVRVHERFMASPGHRANVLDRRFTHGGVGAAAADNKRFQGYVQNTRMYTELFMQAGGAAPPPAPAPRPAPPAGGGGGAAPVGGGGAAARPDPAAPVSQPKPKSRPKVVVPLRMTELARPESAAGLDGVAVVVSAPSDGMLLRRLQADEVAAARAAAHEVTQPAQAADKAPAAAVTPMEVSAPRPAEQGLVESIVGGILGLLFG